MDKDDQYVPEKWPCGHPYIWANMRISPLGYNRRECKQCYLQNSKPFTASHEKGSES